MTRYNETVVDLLENRKLPELTNAQQQSMDRGVKGLVVLRKLAAYSRYSNAAAHYEEWSRNHKWTLNF